MPTLDMGVATVLALLILANLHGHFMLKIPTNVPTEKFASNMKKASDQFVAILNAAEADAKQYLFRFSYAPEDMAIRDATLKTLADVRSDIKSAANLRTTKDDGEDSSEWQRIMDEIRGESWLSTTEVTAEAVFYKAIADTFAYSRTAYDPFVGTKFADLQASQAFIEEVSSALPDMVNENMFAPSDALQKLVYLSMLAGKRDIDLFSENNGNNGARGASRRRKAFVDCVAAASQQYLIHDDVGSVVEYLCADLKSRADLSEGDGVKSTSPSIGAGDIAIVVCNTGKELVADLALAQILLTLNFCETVTIHARSYPVGLVGATKLDVLGHIEHLADPSKSDVWAVRHFGENVRNHLKSGRLVVDGDGYWCQPTPFWEMPDRMVNKLKGSKMVFLKGETNYRRLLGDRLWPTETSSKDIFSYWPTPLCAMRFLKSEVACGIPPGTKKRLLSEGGSTWMTAGNCGMIQYSSKDNSQ